MAPSPARVPAAPWRPSSRLSVTALRRSEASWALRALLLGTPAWADEPGRSPFLSVFAQDLPRLGAASMDAKGGGLECDDSDAVSNIGGRPHHGFGAAAIAPKRRIDAPSSDGAVRRAWLEATLKLHDAPVAFRHDLAPATRPADDAWISLGAKRYPDDGVTPMADHVHARADPSAASATGRRLDGALFIGRLQPYR